MFVSTFLLTIIGTYITDKIIEPRLGKYTGEEVADTNDLTDIERKGLRAAGITVLVFIAIILALILPENAILKIDGNLKDWTSHGLVPLTLMMFFLFPGLVYGRVVGTIKSDKDIAKMIGSAMATMGGYLALVFAAAQFVAYFNYTHLGTFIAVKVLDF